jgi:hypothetical protein
MKYINLILSVLVWMVASVAMAVTLPTSSYVGSSFGGSDSYETLLGTGVRMNVSEFLQASSSVDVNACTIENVPRDPDICNQCCRDEILAKGGGVDEYLTCHDACTHGAFALNEEKSPLGEALVLLPFIAIYAVVRRYRKDNAEQA